MTQSVRSTSACVDFITRARWKDVPPDAAQLATRCIIDGLGVILAGSTTEGSTILRDYVRRTDGGRSTVSRGRFPRRRAARVPHAASAIDGLGRHSAFQTAVDF